MVNGFIFMRCNFALKFKTYKNEDSINNRGKQGHWF